jgi:hypothetical protein
MRYETAIKILLEGTCGANTNRISRESGVSRVTVEGFLKGTRETEKDSLDKIGLWLFRRLNSHVLLTKEELEREYE